MRGKEKKDEREKDLELWLQLKTKIKFSTILSKAIQSIKACIKGLKMNLKLQERRDKVNI